MTNSRKLSYLIAVAVVFLSALGAVGLLWIRQTKPYEITEEIWLPERFVVVNLIGDEFINIEEIHVNNTAISVTFDSFKQNFKDLESKIYFRTDGIVCYVVEKEGENFFIRVYYLPLSVGTRNRLKVSVLTDPWRVRALYGRNWLVMIFGMFISTLFLALFFWSYCRKTIK